MLFLLLAEHWSHGEAGLVETDPSLHERPRTICLRSWGPGESPHRAPDSDISFLGQASGAVAITGCAHQRVHCPHSSAELDSAHQMLFN